MFTPGLDGRGKGGGGPWRMVKISSFSSDEQSSRSRKETVGLSRLLWPPPLAASILKLEHFEEHQALSRYHFNMATLHWTWPPALAQKRSLRTRPPIDTVKDLHRDARMHFRPGLVLPFPLFSAAIPKITPTKKMVERESARAGTYLKGGMCHMRCVTILNVVLKQFMHLSARRGTLLAGIPIFLKPISNHLHFSRYRLNRPIICKLSQTCTVWFPSWKDSKYAAKAVCVHEHY